MKKLMLVMMIGVLAVLTACGNKEAGDSGDKKSLPLDLVSEPMRNNSANRFYRF